MINLKKLLSNLVQAQTKIGAMSPDLSRLNKQYPIGSIYTTNTNTNPENLIGGSWSLVDKYMSPATFSISGDTNSNTYISWNTTNTNNVNGNRGCTILRFPTFFYVFIRYYNNVAISDTDTTICTFSWSNMGGDPNFTVYFIGHSDDNQALGMYVLDATGGTVRVVDWVNRGSGYTSTTNKSTVASFMVPVNITNRSDAACDTFVWKRDS